MNKKLSGLIGIILSILLLIYFETFFYKVIGIIGINISNYSSMIQTIINLGIKLIMCFILYLIYKKDFKSRKRSTNNIIKTTIIFIVSLICIVIGMYLFDKTIKFIGDIFDVNIIEKSFYNIFDKQLNFDLIAKIISDYVIIPYLYCSVIILSVDKFIRHNNTAILFSGLLASIIYALSLSGTLGFVIVNSLSTFLLFGILMFLYRKYYSISFIITIYSFYLISNIFILNYLGW